MSGVRIVSLIMGLISIAVGVLYLGPSQWVRLPLPPGQETLVVIIESFGPVWPVVFMVTGALLATAAVWGRWAVGAHIVGIFGWMFYGVSIISGSVLSEPPAPIAFGVVAIGIAGIHFGMTRAHQEVGG